MDGVSGNFGVEPFHRVNGGGPSMKDPKGGMMPHGHNAKMMHDGARAIGEHVGRGGGKMPAQAHPDHGPHFHVTTLREAQQG